MTTEKQRQAARENIRKAQAKWQQMSTQERRHAQPNGSKRADPGTKGEGDYYRIILRPAEDFEIFRNHDVGEPGGLLRVSGRRASGKWDTQAWLISKEDAHIEDNHLVPQTDDVKDLLKSLGSQPAHKEGDVFTARVARSQ
jgi:hypothetical protein